DADGEADLLVRVRRETLQRGSGRCQLLPAAEHFSTIQPAHPGGEFVAAKPRYQVAGPHQAAQQFGRRAQGRIALGMAVTVVDLLEIVEIDIEQRAALA